MIMMSYIVCAIFRLDLNGEFLDGDLVYQSFWCLDPLAIDKTRRRLLFSVQISRSLLTILHPKVWLVSWYRSSTGIVVCVSC